MKKTTSFNATTMRNLLTTLLIIVIILAGIGFYYGFTQIKTYATQVNQTVAEAHASATPTTSLNTQQLAAALQKETNVTTTLTKFYASPVDFQAGAIQDITKYAQLSNLSIGDVSLDSAAPAGQPTLTVALKAPVSYTALLTFITYIQNGLPKMQLQGIDIQHKTGGGANTVTATSLTIGVMVQ